jgi:hypothetical protein
MATPPLVIHIGRQLDGYAFQLEPHSRAWLRQAHPGLHVARQVFVAFDTRRPFDELQGDVKGMVATTLTGLSPSELEALGGITFQDPSSDAAAVG